MDRGIVRWLRPEFQNPSGVKQTEIDVEEVGDELWWCEKFAAGAWIGAGGSAALDGEWASAVQCRTEYSGR